MEIIALLLYGSCARGDDRPESDIDILAIHTGEYHKHVVQRRVNISFYSVDELKSLVDKNSLFALHLHLEGKVIFETEAGFVERVLSGVSIEGSRENDLLLATEVGEYILRFWNKIENFKYRNARIAWVVRTILILKSIDARSPAFNENGLMMYAKDEKFRRLINSKGSNMELHKNKGLLRRFLDEFGDKRFENPVSNPRGFIRVSKVPSDLRQLVKGLTGSRDSGDDYA